MKHLRILLVGLSIAFSSPETGRGMNCYCDENATHTIRKSNGATCTFQAPGCAPTYDSLGCTICVDEAIIFYPDCTDGVQTPVTVFFCGTADAPGLCNAPIDCDP